MRARREGPWKLQVRDEESCEGGRSDVEACRRSVAKQQNNNSGAHYLDFGQIARAINACAKYLQRGSGNQTTTSQDRSPYAGTTFPPLVARVRQGCLPSYWPTTTRRGIMKGAWPNL